ncbi:MAG TPA: diacylglycerol kinase family protein [Flavipsychrobacter sp.]|nr:diacylglycerol kinase family protein [Flavipsychrobacter sp.]
MNEKKPTKLRRRANSFVYAFRGIAQLMKRETNAKIHLLITVAVISLGIIKGLTTYQWIAIVIAICLVWITEGLNTAIEILCDLYCGKEYNESVKIIKDISAGAVLIAAIASVVIGAFVFLKF